MDPRTRRILATEFAGSSVKGSYKALLPLFKFQVQVSVLAQTELSIFAQFLLRSAHAGCTSVVDIAQLLGVEARHLTDPGAELIQFGLLRQGEPSQSGDRQVEITQKGHEFIESQSKLFAPKKRRFNLFLEPLTRELTAGLNKDEFLTSTIANRSETVAFPLLGSQPVAEDVSPSLICGILGSEMEPGMEIVDLLSVSDSTVVFVPVLVFLLRNPRTSERHFAVFANSTLKKELSYKISQSSKQGLIVVPSELDEAESDTDSVFRYFLPSQSGSAYANYLTSTRKTLELQDRISDTTELFKDSETELEREERNHELEILRGALTEERAQRKQAEHRLEFMVESKPEILNCANSRSKMFEALQASESEVIIMSPWMNSRAIDRGFAESVRAATDRGVRVHIAYGSRNCKPQELQDNRLKINGAIENLRRAMVGGKKDNLILRDLGSIHQKVLSSDCAFVVIGSFNWLSYRGERDDSFREELSVVITYPDHVRNLLETVKGELQRGAVETL